MIKIGADSYEFQQKAREVEQGLEGVSKRLDKLGKELSLKLTAPLAVLGGVSLHLYDIQAKAEAKVQQAIKSTVGAAKLSFEQLKAYASQLQGKTLFGDERILNDSTAQLLTFTNIAGENFKRTQRVALDLSTVLDGDLKSASIQLGKALNDPVKNLSALSRSGIQFSEEQKKVVNSLAETGRLAEAQAVILDELERQYGGQAEAAAKVGIGSLQQLKNSWGDFLEQIGAAMMPMMNRLAASLKNVVEWLQNLSPATKRTIVVVASVAAAVGPVALGLGSLLKMLPLLKTGFAVLIAPIGAVRTALQALTVAMATNPIGLLLTALSAGVGLFLAFRKSTDEATEAAGEHTAQILDESKQVNMLIAKLASANTSEQERKTALEELRKIQPAIVEGLNAEQVELETLTKRASEYNQQLVLRIALARKQDQVAAAIERQTEAGVKQAEKEASLYKYLSEVQAQVLTGKIEVGNYNPSQGLTKWRAVTEQERKKLVAEYAAIMSSSDDLLSKAQKVNAMFTSSPQSMRNFRGVDTKELRAITGGIRELQQEVQAAAGEVKSAEDDVRNFAETFSLSLQTAVEDTVTTTETVATSTDKVGKTAEAAKGRIALLGEEIKRLETLKQSAFEVAEIAQYNSEIARLKKQVEELNSVTTEYLAAREKGFQPINVPPMIVPKLSVELKNPILEGIQAQMERVRAIRESVASELTSWAGTMGAGVVAMISDASETVAVLTDTMVEKGYSFAEALSTVSTRVTSMIKSFNDGLKKFLTDSIAAVFDAIGQIIAGDMGLDGLLNAVLLQLASFLKQIGTQLIEFGLMVVAFQSALKSVLANPWVAIGVGAAMVAAAAVMTALINKNAEKNVPKLAQGGLAYGPTYAMVGDNPGARVDPEVIAPLSKLRSMMTGGGTQNIAITLGGQLTAKGRDLVYVLSKENFKIDIIGN